jgi:hypothetical protein
MRRFVLCLSLLSLAFVPLYASPPNASAASCVRFVASQFDAPGNDNFNLNAEWVRIKNFCSTRKNISGWKIHDYNRIHIYTFGSSVRIDAGKTITLFTGSGSDTRAKKFWKMGSAVWNNDPPERAYLKMADGTLRSTWTE